MPHLLRVDHARSGAHTLGKPRRCRFLPLLRPHLVPYQLHLFAERSDCMVQRVAELLEE